MTDDTTPLANTEQPEAASGAEEQDQPVSLLDALDGAEQQDGQPQPEDDSEEVEWDGKKFRGPKGLKDGILRQADYTRKTQEVADRRRELDAREERISQQSQASDQDFQERAWLVNADARYRQLTSEIDAAHKANDPFQAQQLGWEREKLRDDFQAVTQSVNQRAKQRSQEAQRDAAKRFADTEAWANQNIPGHTDEVARRVFAFAEAEGIDKAMLQKEMKPAFYKLLHRAMIGDQALRRPPSTARTQPQAQPTQTVRPGGGAPAQRDPSDMSMSDFAANWKKRHSG